MAIILQFEFHLVTFILDHHSSGKEFAFTVIWLHESLSFFFFILKGIVCLGILVPKGQLGCSKTMTFDLQIPSNSKLQMSFLLCN